MKQRIRLNEAQLQQIVKESVKKILREEEGEKEQWYAVWVAPKKYIFPNRFQRKNLEGYTRELILVKATNEEDARWDAEEIFLHKNRRYMSSSDDAATYGCRIATKEDFERYKSGNRFEWVEVEKTDNDDYENDDYNPYL